MNTDLKRVAQAKWNLTRAGTHLSKTHSLVDYIFRMRTQRPAKNKRQEAIDSRLVHLIQESHDLWEALDAL
jgi:hypothetical protein